MRRPSTRTMSSLTIRGEGFGERLKELGEDAGRIATQTINASAEYAHGIGRAAMLDEIAFPTHYIDYNQNFHISKEATPSKPVAVISARYRPTSLARFVVDNQKEYSRGGLRLKVKQRKPATLWRRAWLTGLKNGNYGFAVRVPPGGTLKGRRKGVSGLPVLREDRFGTSYLLYGPSVGSAFKGVRGDIQPKVGDFMTKDFSRRFQAATRRSMRGSK